MAETDKMPELTELRAEIASLKAEVAQLRKEQTLRNLTLPSPNQTEPTSRRKLLKKIGAMAAGISAASVATLASGVTNTAQAADGDFMLLGNSNLASNSTYLSQVSGATPTGKAILWGDWNTSAATLPSIPANVGLAGTAGKSTGDNGGIGGFFRGNQAALLLNAGELPVANPNSGTTPHLQGEIYVDSNGGIWFCVISGTPGSWRKLAGSDSMGTYHMLPASDRFLDTRSGTILAVNSVNNFTLTGVNGSFNTSSIPTGARGITGTITALSSTGAGLLKIYATDFVPNPPNTGNPPYNYTTSLINYATNVTVNNGFVCRLSSSGQITVYVATASTHVIIDVTGYYL